MSVGWIAAGATHVGQLRRGNEDSYRLDPDAGVFLVADGMGGHAAGEVASELAARGSLELLVDQTRLADPEERLTAAFAEAQRRIVEYSAGDPATAGMGTTLTALLLSPSGTFHFGHIGDSRIYKQSGEMLHQVTRDHTWVQQEVDAGRVRPEEAGSHPLSHILSRVLTADDPAAPDLGAGAAKAGDTLLLSTDGLYNMVGPQELLAALRSREEPAQICAGLIRAANNAGGYDNITLIVIRIEEG